MIIKPGLVLFFIIQVLLCSAWGNGIEATRKKIETQKEELTGLDRKIREYEKRIDQLTDREEELFKELSEIKQKIERQGQQLEHTAAEIQKVEGRIRNLNESLDRARKEGKQYSNHLKKTLKYYYYKNMKGEINPWYGVYGKNNGDFVNYSGELVAAPAQKYTEIQQEIQKINNLTRSLKKENERLVDLREKQVSMQKNHRNRREEHLGILKSVEKRRAEQKKEIQNLQNEREQLENLIESLNEEVKNLERLDRISGHLVKAKGELPWPAEGEIVSRYGRQPHPRLNTYIYNRGIRIAVAQNEQIKSVAVGEVVYADLFQGRGKMIVVDHGEEHYTIYGDLGRIMVELGQEIEILDTLGLSGESPIYFEIGKGASPLEPLEWLKK